MDKRNILKINNILINNGYRSVFICGKIFKKTIRNKTYIIDIDNYNKINFSVTIKGKIVLEEISNELKEVMEMKSLINSFSHKKLSEFF